MRHVDRELRRHPPGRRDRGLRGRGGRALAVIDHPARTVAGRHGSARSVVGADDDPRRAGALAAPAAGRASRCAICWPNICCAAISTIRGSSVASLTVAEVRVSRDLKSATGVRDRARRRAAPGDARRRCSRPSAHLAGWLARQMHLKYAPRLRFVPDETFADAARIGAAAARARSGRGRPTRTRPMGRRKPSGRPINGWLVIDKPAGHDLDPCGQRGQAPDPGAEGRPWRHARPAGDRRAADRDGRGDQDRGLHHGRPQGLRFHAPLRRGARHRRRRGRGHRHQRQPADRRRDPAGACRSSSA